MNTNHSTVSPTTPKLRGGVSRCKSSSYNVNYLKRLYAKFRNLILYGMIGCLSSSLDFCAYTFLVKVADVRYFLANCISVLVGISVSFCLNRQYNFKVKDKTARRFVTFATIGLCGMMLSNIILFICIDKLTIDQLVSKLLSIVLVVVTQFLLNKYITFKESTK